jgi:hypothetical protein
MPRPLLESCPSPFGPWPPPATVGHPGGSTAVWLGNPLAIGLTKHAWQERTQAAMAAALRRVNQLDTRLRCLTTATKSHAANATNMRAARQVHIALVPWLLWLERCKSGC